MSDRRCIAASEFYAQAKKCAYVAANRLERSETASGLTTYTFDPDGNQRSAESPSGDLTTYGWDYEDQLVSVEDPLGDLTTYAYTGLDQRLSQESPSHRASAH